jgi:hypothetical protein
MTDKGIEEKIKEILIDFKVTTPTLEGTLVQALTKLVEDEKIGAYVTGQQSYQDKLKLDAEKIRKSAVIGFAEWYEKQLMEFYEVNFGYKPHKVVEKAKKYLAKPSLVGSKDNKPKTDKNGLDKEK